MLTVKSEINIVTGDAVVDEVSLSPTHPIIVLLMKLGVSQCGLCVKWGFEMDPVRGEFKMKVLDIETGRDEEDVYFSDIQDLFDGEFYQSLIEQLFNPDIIQIL